MSRDRLPEAAAAIRSAKKLALACHVGPDGDALGSMLGFGIAARENGKEVVASFGSPFAMPDNLAFLPSDFLVPPNDFPERPELMVVFDAGSSDRLGELGSNASDASGVVVIDHHVTNEGFGTISMVDPGSAATGELVIELLDILGWAIGEEAATCLHTALVTDTGKFQYSNVTPRTFELAARMLAAGAEPAEISRKVYEELPFGYLSAAGAALARAELDEELSLVTTVITSEDLRQAGIDWGDIDNLINTVRLAREADVAIVAKDHGDGRVKMSIRSRGATDVGGLAAALGGGGHRLAAGFTFNGTPSDGLALIKQRLPEFR